MAEFQSIPHSSTWHFTFHGCIRHVMVHKLLKAVSLTKICLHTVQYTTHTHNQMQAQIDESICCINTINMLNHKYTLGVKKKTHSTHSIDVYQDRVMVYSGGAKQTYTHWLAPMGEATGPPVWWLGLTSTFFLSKQTAAVWSIRSCCRTEQREFFFFLLLKFPFMIVSTVQKNNAVSINNIT